MSMPDTLDLPSTTSPTRQTDMETDMNNNKTWAVTIQLTVVSTEDPLDDDAFFRALCEFTNEAGGTTFEGALLVGAKAVELEARSYTLKTEPVTEPAVDMALLLPYLPPTPMEAEADKVYAQVMGHRAQREARRAAKGGE